MNTFFQHLSDPEYMHVLLNPLPVYGLAIGVLALALTLFLRNERVTIAALVLVFVSALSAWPAYHYGEAAYDRVKAMSDPAGEQWLDEHMARGEKLIWLFYILAGAAALGAVAVVKWPRATFTVTTGALVLGAAVLGAGFYIAYAGGHIRHREFRFEPPPAAQNGEHHHGSESEQDHAAMVAPSAGGDQSPQVKHGVAQPGTSPRAAEQLEASRLQLEASRLQLEASRKQLEATEAAKSGSPSPQPGQSPHAEDGHEHEPKP